LRGVMYFANGDSTFDEPSPVAEGYVPPRVFSSRKVEAELLCYHCKGAAVALHPLRFLTPSNRMREIREADYC